jgi:hypothetical protein
VALVDGLELVVVEGALGFVGHAREPAGGERPVDGLLALAQAAGSRPDRRRAKLSRSWAFDRFRQGGRGERAGTGLGLPIAAQVERAGGGALHLQPAPGGGVDALISLASDRS